MKTGIKKISAVLCSTVLLAGVAAGCGGNDKESKETAAPESSNAAKSPSDPPAKLTVEVFDRGFRGSRI